MRKFFNSSFKKNSVYLQPGDYYVTDEDTIIETVLGSCISVCLFSDFNNFVGMNHFMLPDKTDTENFTQTSSGRYGMYAMEILINSFLKNGVKKNALKAKIFGGGNVINFDRQNDGIASNNIKFIINYMHDENIPILSSHLGGNKARKILFFSKTKKVLLKEISEKEKLKTVNEEKEYKTKILEENQKSNIIFFD